MQQQRGSMAGLRQGQASLMAGKPAEAADGAVQAILHGAPVDDYPVHLVETWSTTRMGARLLSHVAEHSVHQ